MILIQDVDNLGMVNEVVSVKSGYARNYLIPKKMAVEMSVANRGMLKARLRALEIKEAKMMAEISAVIQKIQENVLRIQVKVGGQGKIFGSITNVLLAKEIRHQLGLHIDRKKIMLPDHIADLGTHEAEIIFAPTKKAVFKFELINEDA